MQGHYKKVSSVKKTFPKPVPTEQYEQAPGPDRPTAMQRFESEHQFISGAAHRVKDSATSGVEWMKKRGREIQEEAPRTMPRSPMISADPFGMRSAGNPFRTGPMSGPFMDQAGPIRREPAAPKRRRKRRVRRQDDDYESRSPAFADPFHIPKSMRHMF